MRAFFGYGIPVLLHTDNGTEFAGEVAQTCKAFGVEMVHGRPYHPQTQGCVERRVQTLKRRLAAIFATGDCTDWERGLAHIEYQINITWTNSIGMSPWEAVYGHLGGGVWPLGRRCMAREKVRSSLPTEVHVQPPQKHSAPFR